MATVIDFPHRGSGSVPLGDILAATWLDGHAAGAAAYHREGTPARRELDELRAMWRIVREHAGLPDGETLAKGMKARHAT